MTPTSSNRHTGNGRSPSGPGYSAEPEPSCTVSAVPVSIPNADHDYDDDLEFGHCGNIGCEDGWVADCFDGFCVNAEDGCAACLRRCDWCNPRLASGMEAPSGGETAQTGSTEGDSPARKAGDAHND